MNRRPMQVGIWMILAAASAASGDSGSLWTELSRAEVTAAGVTGERWIVPERARLVRLDPHGLAALLALAPGEDVAPDGMDGIELAIPDPDEHASERRYRIVDSPVMAPELAARYPEWRTFRLIDVADPRYGGRGDWTLHGFHAMVRTPSGTFFVDPLRAGDRDHYQVYWRRELAREVRHDFRCDFEDEVEEHGDEGTIASMSSDVPDGGLDLRTYRTAVAATGEYTQFHGGTVPAGMAAIVTAMNRVNEVFELEVAIRMILVPNNDLVVYTDGATDPYTNNDGSAMLGQNQTNLERRDRLGELRHRPRLLDRRRRHRVARRSLCERQQGARCDGVELADRRPVRHRLRRARDGSPVGSAPHVQRFHRRLRRQPHGLHGLRAGQRLDDHVLRGNLRRRESAAAQRRLTSTAAASTRSSSFSRSGGGNGCAAFVADGNAAPVVDAGDDYTIPLATPFALTGGATDADGDTAQFLLGAVGSRSRGPGTSPAMRRSSARSTRSSKRRAPFRRSRISSTARRPSARRCRPMSARCTSG